jgi:hypothetical protein
MYQMTSTPRSLTSVLISRNGSPRHHNIYYHVTDVTELAAPVLNGVQESIEVASQRLVSQVEDVLGYIFRSKPLDENQQADGDEALNVSTHTCTPKLYRCSQDKSLANYSKYQFIDDLRKRRQRTVQERYDCAGALDMFIPSSPGATIQPSSLVSIALQKNEVVLRFRHKCRHPPRDRKPMPKAVREYLRDPANESQMAHEAYGKLVRAVAFGVLKNVDMIAVTSDNVRYWWTQIKKQDYQRDDDPWVLAVAFVEEQPAVVVHSYIEQRRQFFCWFVYDQIGVDMPNITEVFINSTHGTNGQNAELFAMIGCEGGYGVLIGYMLMEKKPTEDSKLFPGEVTMACTTFFGHAKQLGLSPIIVHLDKCVSEIAASRVRQSASRSNIQVGVGWPNSTISLCSWHMDKDIRERLHARDKENVLHRTSHAWSQFSNHPELGFIDVDFLQAYRDKRTRIIRKRIDDTKDEEITLSQKQLGTKEETILDKDAIQPIQTPMRKHLHWHPFKFPSSMPPLNGDSPLTSRYCWLR